MGEKEKIAVSKEEKEKKCFKKIRNIADYLLRLIAFFIITAILWKNLCLNNFLISSEVLVLICFLLITSIGTAYDKISVAKLIELKKDIKIKNEESNEYKNRYDTIAKEFATVLRITQQQTINNNNNIVNKPSTNLESSSENEKNTLNKLESENVEDVKTDLKTNDNNQMESSISFEDILWKQYESQFIEAKQANVQKDIKISFTNDVSCTSTIFDRYYKSNNIEYFVEFKTCFSGTQIRRMYDDIEKKINLINQRKKEKNIDAKLHYILAYKDNNRDIVNQFMNIAKDFSPAIASGVLRIIPTSIEDKNDKEEHVS